MIYRLKKWIIQRGINYRKRKHPFNERLCELFDLPADASRNINSSFFLGGHTVNGETITMRFGFRNGADCEIFVLYRHNGKLLYMESDHYAKEQFPAQAKCEVVGKRWIYSFDGNMVDKEGVSHQVKFELIFKARLPIYDFMQSAEKFEGMARAIAREKWNKKFFSQLSEINSRHYEQTGHVDGWIDVDGRRSDISLMAARDRAVGHRKWDYMNNHIWLNCLTEKGEALTFAIVNYPAVKNLYSGYTDFQSDRNATLTDYHGLCYNHNGGKGSDTIEVTTRWSNGKTLRIKATRDENVKCNFDNGAYFFQEGIGQFTINGVPARGNIEYGFNRNPERWSEYK